MNGDDEEEGYTPQWIIDAERQAFRDAQISDIRERAQQAKDNDGDYANWPAYPAGRMPETEVMDFTNRNIRAGTDRESGLHDLPYIPWDERIDGKAQCSHPDGSARQRQGAPVANPTWDTSAGSRPGVGGVLVGLLLLGLAMAALFLLSGCGPAPLSGDPNVAIGQAQGQLQSTAQAQAQQIADNAATQAAVDQSVRLTQWAAQMQQTAEAAQATYQAQDAIATAMKAGAQATSDAQWLSSIGAQATATALAVQATETAQERAAQATRKAQAQLVTDTRVQYFFYLIYSLCVALTLAGVWVMWQAALFGRRLMDARAAAAEADVRQKLVRLLPDGRIVDLIDGDVVIVGPRLEQLALAGPPEIAPLETVKGDRVSETIDFIQRAAAAHGANGWNSNIIPRFDRMGVTGEKWDSITNLLVSHDLIDKAPGRSTFVKKHRSLNALLNEVIQLGI